MRKRDEVPEMEIKIHEYMQIKNSELNRPRRQTARGHYKKILDCTSNGILPEVIKFKNEKKRIKSMESSFHELEPWEVTEINEEPPF